MHGHMNVKISWYAGLYTIVITTPWEWHFVAETCRSWYK